MAKWKAMAVAVLLALAVAIPAGGAAKEETTALQAGSGATEDPLLRLLVEKGIITREEAVALQVESEGLEDPLLVLLVAKGIITQEEAGALRAELQASSESGKVPGENPDKKSWTDRVKPGGDIRLRYEGFDQETSFDDDRRDRFRVRLRAGARFIITERMTAGLQLRSGDPDDPVSNNTSFDGGSRFKEFNLGEGYLEVHPVEKFGFIGGKFDAKKWWTVSDLQWDDDVTVEGLMTNTDLASGHGAFKGLDLVAYAYILEESKDASDAYTFGGQLRTNFRMGEDNALRVGVGFDQWDHPQEVVDLTLSGELRGNKVTNFLDGSNQLISDFEILNAFAEFKNTGHDRWPVSFKLYYYKNLGAEGIGADNDTGYFGRVQVGDYKKKGQVAFRYAYYYSEPDALFYVFTQSDTSRGSNVEAHRFDLRIGFVARSYFNVTWYNTKPAFGEDETLDRWQLDYIVKF